jgi:mRNA-degrading endonuclease RelE of RelBE toxin-antitoxin system
MNLGFTPSFDRSLKELPEDMQSDVREFIVSLKKAKSLTEITNVRKLSGSDFYRKRIKSLRVLFSWDKKTQTIVLCLVDQRKDVYKKRK